MHTIAWLYSVSHHVASLYKSVLFILLWLFCGPFCFTSTEVRWLIRDGDRGGRGWKSEALTADTTWKRPERLWTAARTIDVLRRWPLTIAQQLVHCTFAVSTAVLGQSHRDNVRCTAVEEQLEAKEVQLLQPSSHLPTYDLFWANLKVQLHLPPLDLLISCGTLWLFCINLYSLSYHVASL